MTHAPPQKPDGRRTRRPWGRLLRLAGLTLAAALLPAALGLSQVHAQTPGERALRPMPGPRVMLCVYADGGRLLAGSLSCPDHVQPQGTVTAQAHCFYDLGGYLWHGLPRCPSNAPAFLMDEARRAHGAVN